ncbi:MAG: hypothetical protein AB1793_00240 [Candidatus Thermoplasmatota archaeon]
MVKNEAKKLEALAKTIHLCCDDSRYYGRNDWQEVVVDAGLGIDRRTADSYYRLSRVRGLINEQTQWRWRKGKEFERFLPKIENRESQLDAEQQEGS